MSKHHIADRLTTFGTSIFAEMTRLATERGAINLAQGFPDFDGPDHVKLAAAQAVQAGHGQYARMFGLPALNQAVAGWMKRQAGMTVDPDREVTVTAGCTEAIAATILGLVNPGDEVILFEPYYDSYRACVSMAGATPRFVTLRAPDFTFDADELRRAFTSRTKAILVNTPQNPTGRVFTREELSAIAELCIQHGVIALADEVYEKLVFEGDFARLATLPGMAERTVTMSSLGKTFSLTGWKIGWTVAPAELTAGVRAAHQFLTFAVSTPMQHAAVVALNSPQSYFDRLLSEYRRKRDFLGAALSRLGFQFRPPEGSYFIYADHTPISSKLGLGDDVAFCKAMIEKVSVAAIPPTAFYENKEEGKRLVRFAFCKKDETLRAAVERLSALASG
ncbi:MAG TPA: aminotransferase class I/II-fold pyridoxal phosphate-dependent enzyme [Phycisphaerales bacterium]|nr:aminotransferase class I/II-fold pyridoxal phosphate-dependent enzyme [Phycisphaerales bacterium]